MKVLWNPNLNAVSNVKHQYQICLTHLVLFCCCSGTWVYFRNLTFKATESLGRKSFSTLLFCAYFEDQNLCPWVYGYFLCLCVSKRITEIADKRMMLFFFWILPMALNFFQALFEFPSNMFCNGEDVHKLYRSTTNKLERKWKIY